MSADCWWMVEIEDPDALSGPSLGRLVQVLCSVRTMSHVAAIGVEGGGEGINTLKEAEGFQIVSVAEFLADLPCVVQFDWGNFYLSDEPGRLLLLESGQPYREAILHAVVTIRAVDDTWFHVFFQDPAFLAMLDVEYPSTKKWVGPLGSMWYPE